MDQFPDQRSQPRRFLFLQGMATCFFAHLASALVERGHMVRRINFNGGDRLFWSLPGAVDYRGDLTGWPAYLSRKLADWGITDIILFGDCRPLHVSAIRVASLRGVPVHVFEEGYLRPNFVTLEQTGVNGNSLLPKEPDWFRDAARSMPEWDGGKPVQNRFSQRAITDVAYHITCFLTAWYYRGYKTHLCWHPFLEYAGWLRRFARMPAAKRRTQKTLRVLAAWRGPCYLFPLQLDCDSQIRVHSPFGRLAPAIELIIRSFAHHAPQNSCLVLKGHPLDPGLYNWRATASSFAHRLGICDRIFYLEDGALETLLEHARGIITVNSTAGLMALSYGRPVITLGRSIYDMPSLTFQGGLDRFWKEAEPPDAVTFDAFRRVVAELTQVNGGFFSTQGSKMAVSGAVQRLEQGTFRTPAVSVSGLDEPLAEEVSPHLTRMPI